MSTLDFENKRAKFIALQAIIDLDSSHGSDS